jgi:conjugal transfer pilus assembly protein TraB
MRFLDALVGRKPAEQPQGTDDDSVSPVGSAMTVNDSVRKRQRLLLGGVAAIALAGASWWIFSADKKPEALASSDPKEVKVTTGDLVNRNMSEQEWMARSENRFASTDNRLRAVDGQATQLAAMQKEMDALRGQNSAMSSDGQRVLSAYQTENETLKSQLATAQAAPAPTPGPTALYGPGSPGLYQPPGGGVPAPATVLLPREVKTVSFTTNGQGGGNATRAERGTTVFSDSPDYLPANSFATARVIVGVDASAGVSSQTDPLPVVLRITGPAPRSDDKDSGVSDQRCGARRSLVGKSLCEAAAHDLHAARRSLRCFRGQGLHCLCGQVGCARSCCQPRGQSDHTGVPGGTCRRLRARLFGEHQQPVSGQQCQRERSAAKA